MKNKRIYGFLIIILAAMAQTATAQSFRATSFEIVKNEDSFAGKLFIKTDGKNREIASEALNAWIIGGGKQIVYSGADGAGGFENEGQSLRIYDVKTGATRKILSQYTMVTGVSEKRLSNGKNVLLVRLEDGGLGGSYFSVLDPLRGEVFHRPLAELTEIRGDRITLAFFNADDWESVIQQRGEKDYQNQTAIPTKTNVKPRKIETHDLKTILRNKVIYNKPTNAFLEKGLKRVKIYLWCVNYNVRNKPFVLGTVEREVESTAPLRPTLEELFSGATKDEEARGLGTTTFGMKFEGVTLKNGTATVKFSQPKDQTNYGSTAPFIFAEAIEKTAKQFPTVKKVIICAVGETLFDSQLQKPFPRCQ